MKDSSISIERKNNATVLRRGINALLFSYDTLVAAFIEGAEFRTYKKYSATTIRHINAFGVSSDAELVSPEQLSELSKQF